MPPHVYILRLGRLIVNKQSTRIPCLSLNRNFKRFLHPSPLALMTEPTPDASEQVVLDQDGKPLSKGALKKLEKQREKDLRKAETAARLVHYINAGGRKASSRLCQSRSLISNKGLFGRSLWKTANEPVGFQDRHKANKHLRYRC